MTKFNTGLLGVNINFREYARQRFITNTPLKQRRVIRGTLFCGSLLVQFKKNKVFKSCRKKQNNLFSEVYHCWCTIFDTTLFNTLHLWFVPVVCVLYDVPKSEVSCLEWFFKNFTWPSDRRKQLPSSFLSAHLWSRWDSVQFAKFRAKVLLNCRFVFPLMLPFVYSSV